MYKLYDFFVVYIIVVACFFILIDWYVIQVIIFIYVDLVSEKIYTYSVLFVNCILQSNFVVQYMYYCLGHKLFRFHFFCPS